MRFQNSLEHLVHEVFGVVDQLLHNGARLAPGILRSPTTGEAHHGKAHAVSTGPVIPREPTAILNRLAAGEAMRQAVVRLVPDAAPVWKLSVVVDASIRTSSMPAITA